jgi:hypothetical protein
MTGMSFGAFLQGGSELADRWNLKLNYDTQILLRLLANSSKFSLMGTDALSRYAKCRETSLGILRGAQNNRT